MSRMGRVSDAYLVKHVDGRYRYRANEWTRSRRLADRFATAAEAWDVLLGETCRQEWPLRKVVRLTSRQCRCSR